MTEWIDQLKALAEEYHFKLEDVATVIGMSLNALLEFKKELNGDVR